MKQAFEIAAIAKKMGAEKLLTEEIRKEFVCETNPKERIDHLVDDVLNKKIVYHIGKDETIMTLAVEASKKALEKANLKSEEIDGIIFTGITREYFSPSTALVLSHELGCKKDLKCCVDTNANCICMITVLYQANAMMVVDEEIQNLLLVDCGLLSMVGAVPEPIAADSVSDSATAIVLKRRAVPAEMYFEGYQDSKQLNAVIGPEKGLTYFLRSKEFNNYLSATNGDLDSEIELVIGRMKSYLKEWHVEDTKAFCLSQYVYAVRLAIIDGLQLDPKMVPYISDQIGYTGPSSPFLALNSMLEKNELKTGDHVFLWTIGTGSQHVFCSITI